MRQGDGKQGIVHSFLARAQDNQGEIDGGFDRIAVQPDHLDHILLGKCSMVNFQGC
jgi:hypothetical protein